MVVFQKHQSSARDRSSHTIHGLSCLLEVEGDRRSFSSWWFTAHLLYLVWLTLVKSLGVLILTTIICLNYLSFQFRFNNYPFIFQIGYEHFHDNRHCLNNFLSPSPLIASFQRRVSRSFDSSALAVHRKIQSPVHHKTQFSVLQRLAQCSVDIWVHSSRFTVRPSCSCIVVL